MLIARAPVRVSFFGGGTDLPSYYQKFEGAVLGAAINRHVYAILNRIDGRVQVSSSDYRTFFRHSESATFWSDELSLPRAVLDRFGVYNDLSIFLASEIPPGTGLGSSGAATVVLVKALAAHAGQLPAADCVAEIASEIEIDQLHQPIGKQDQYLSARGGLNLLEFTTADVKVTPVELPLDVLNDFERRLLLFFVGGSRRSASILAGQTANISEGRDETLGAMHEMKRQAYRGFDLLRAGKLDEFGDLLDQAWQAKKRVAAGVTTPDIDRFYATARAAGALGGKIAGAGGGGFLLVYAPEGKQERLVSRLEEEGLVPMDFRFEKLGATVLFNAFVRL